MTIATLFLSGFEFIFSIFHPLITSVAERCPHSICRLNQIQCSVLLRELNMNFLIKLDSSLARSEAIAVGILLLVMSFFTFLQVIMRYCFSFSIVWCEELTRYCMVWMTFIGTAFAVSKQDHINIDMLTSVVKEKTGFDLRHLLNVLVLIFACFCSFYGMRLMITTAASGQLTPALRIPMWWVYAVMELSLFLTAFHALVRVFDFKQPSASAGESTPK